MTKRINAKYKISRRLGVNLWGRAKDPFEVKNYPPGLHGPLGRKKILSDYGRQLQEKQKLRRYYNIREKQFSTIYKEAARIKGDTGENLIGLLESRLDAVVYRAKFVPTIFAARQFISHKHVLVNGNKVNIPSYRLKEGDVVEVKSKSKELPIVIEAVASPERDVPDYLEVDHKKMSAKFIKTPNLVDVPFPIVIDLNLIIEFYSR